MRLSLYVDTMKVVYLAYTEDGDDSPILTLELNVLE